jgi:2-iminobutanoate/2-iminopropanoate deaminase
MARAPGDAGPWATLGRARLNWAEWQTPLPGAAATTLAGHLAARYDVQDGTLRWTLEQGYEMSRPRLLYLEADKQTAVRVGGSAVLVSEGTINIPGDNMNSPDGERGWEAIELGAGCPAPAGAYSRGIRAGNLLFVSGQVPRDPRTGELQGTDVRTQTKAVVENLRGVLEAGGASLDDVVSVTVYLADIGDWAEFDAVYREAFRKPYPTRTTVGSALKDVLVEISAIAHLH